MRARRLDGHKFVRQLPIGPYIADLACREASRARRSQLRITDEYPTGILGSGCHELAEIGPGISGGSNRQTLTDDDAKGRSLFQSWCESAGMTMGVDQMGTMFARREGLEPDLDPVYIGSHLDTQPTGGRYDGVLGVLSGLEVIRTLNDLGIRTRRPIVVVNWTNEEGARFAPAMMASGVFAGQFSPRLRLWPQGPGRPDLRR